LWDADCTAFHETRGVQGSEILEVLGLEAIEVHGLSLCSCC